MSGSAPTSRARSPVEAADPTDPPAAGTQRRPASPRPATSNPSPAAKHGCEEERRSPRARGDGERTCLTHGIRQPTSVVVRGARVPLVGREQAARRVADPPGHDRRDRVAALAAAREHRRGSGDEFAREGSGPSVRACVTAARRVPGPARYRDTRTRARRPRRRNCHSTLGNSGDGERLACERDRHGLGQAGAASSQNQDSAPVRPPAPARARIRARARRTDRAAITWASPAGSTAGRIAARRRPGVDDAEARAQRHRAGRGGCAAAASAYQNDPDPERRRVVKDRGRGQAMDGYGDGATLAPSSVDYASPERFPAVWAQSRGSGRR